MPYKDLSADAMADYVREVLKSTANDKVIVRQAQSRSSQVHPRVVQTPPRIAPARQPSVRSAPATQTRKATTAPRAVPQVRTYTDQDDQEDMSNRRQGPVIVSMDTQVPDLIAKNNLPMGLGKQMKSDIMIVNTPYYGEVTIPNYDLMSKRDKDIAMESFILKFKHINHDWQHTGDTFDLPRPDEDIVRVAVRYAETERYLSAKTGTDFWFIVLCAFWGFVEYQACSYKLPAKGYLETQIGMYKMYQSQLTRMGTVSNVGADWPPWLQVMVTSGFSMAILVLLSKFGKGAYAATAMKEVSRMISGNRNTDVSDAGTPVPSSGGMIDMISGMAGGGGISTMMTMLSAFTGGDDKGSSKKKKKKKKSKADKAKDNKEAEEAADVDI